MGRPNFIEGILGLTHIYDLWEGEWKEPATLSQPRAYLAATSLDDLAFFGGLTNENEPSDVVDIFDAKTQQWRTAQLSQPRWFLAAASTGEFVAFGGGTTDGSVASEIVDIYNVARNAWTTTTLRHPRYAWQLPHRTIKSSLVEEIMAPVPDIPTLSTSFKLFRNKVRKVT